MNTNTGSGYRKRSDPTHIQTHARISGRCGRDVLWTRTKAHALWVGGKDTQLPNKALMCFRLGT